MNVSDLYERLSYGELSNLHIGLEGQGDVSVDDKPRVLSYINLGLTALYSRFTHKRDYVFYIRDPGGAETGSTPSSRAGRGDFLAGRDFARRSAAH